MISGQGFDFSCLFLLGLSVVYIYSLGNDILESMSSAGSEIYAYIWPIFAESSAIFIVPRCRLSTSAAKVLQYCKPLTTVVVR